MAFTACGYYTIFAEGLFYEIKIVKLKNFGKNLYVGSYGIISRISDTDFVQQFFNSNYIIIHIIYSLEIYNRIKSLIKTNFTFIILAWG